MAHGKKRWIRTFDGKLKRSNDRTKKDYYRGLRYWEPMQRLRRVYGWSQYDGEFCPQCKHNLKAITAHNDAYHAAVKQLEEEFRIKLQPEIEAFEWKYKKWLEMGEYRWAADMPRNPEEDYRRFWKFRAENEYRLPSRPMHDEETYLCPKHRLMFDTKWEMWHDTIPGRKEHWTWAVRQNYRSYRSEVRNIMARAKYDEDYYDDILPYKHDWLD